MIQNDCTKFEMLLTNVANIVAMALCLIGGCVYIGVIFGVGAVVAFFAAFLVSIVLLVLIYAQRIKLAKNLMKAKDKRIALLKNVISNVSYIKMRAWETFYSARVFRVRELEVFQLLKNSVIMGYMIFINWFNRAITLIAVLLYKSIYEPDTFGFNQISAFLRVFDLLRIIILTLPFSIAYMVELSVSMRRLTDFLLIEDLDKSWIISNAA